MANIIIGRGLQSSYDGLQTKNSDTLYFTTDEGNLYLGELLIGSKLKDYSWSASTQILTLTSVDGTETTIDFSIYAKASDLANKVSSVTATANKGIEIGGTATEPTVGIKLDPTSGNAATLGAKGLMVTIPEVDVPIESVSASAGKAITANTSNKAVTIDFLIDSNDKVLTQSASGLLTNLGLTYSNGVLKITGKTSGDAPLDVASVNLPVDTFLDSAEIVVNPEGQPKGTYLVLTFNTASGKEPIYINLSQLIDIYTAGNAAIRVSANKKISLVVDSNSSLRVGSSGLTISEVQASTGGTGGKSGVMTPSMAEKLNSLPAASAIVTDVKVKGVGNSDYTSVVASGVAKIDLSRLVPNTRTINSKSLSGNIVLSGADILATGYSKAKTASPIVATDSINAALGKLEKGIEDATSGGVTSVSAGKGISVSRTTGNVVVSAKLNPAQGNVVITNDSAGLSANFEWGSF